MRLCLEKNLMAKKKPYLQHLKRSQDLVTPYEATRAGFVALALEKNRRATPFVAQARALKLVAAGVKSPAELIKIQEIHAALLTASGISDKASGHLQEQDKADAIQGLIQNFLEPAGANFVEELVFRFLLTRGDSLGGAMRNVGGVLAQRKLTRAIISTLKLAGLSYQWLHSSNNAWAQMPENDADIELYVRGLSWQSGSKSRTLIYNLTVPMVRNNVDLCLFDCGLQQATPATYKLPEKYIALGELKGGIDPAGADEHWKTARTALTRIQSSFTALNLSPQLFFVGAAIEKKMSDEIWKLLEVNQLGNAANLTDEIQVASVARWLCNL
jgi:Restriction endonuclease BsobI